MPQTRKKKKQPNERGRTTGGTGAGAQPYLWNSIVLCIALFIFAVLLYGGTANNEFVWDDRDLIVENRSIGTLDGSAIKSIFLENFWETKDRLGGYYRPLIMLSYKIEYSIYGLSPAGFHTVNIIVNALVSVALFLFVLILFGNRLLALLSALLFTALPLHTENVAWVAGRTDIFAVFWMIVSLLFFSLANRRSRRVFLPLSLAAFFLALLAKEIAVVLPVIVLIVQRIQRSSRRRGTDGGAPRAARAPLRYRTALLFFVPLALYAVLRTAAIGSGVTAYAPLAAGAAAKILLALSIVSGYAAKLIYPFRLSAEYDAPIPGGPADPHAAAGLLVIAGFLYALLRFRNNGVIFLGMAFIALGIAPVLNIISLGEISAERFLYLPSVGFALLLGSFFARMLERLPAIARLVRCYPAPGSRSRIPAAGAAAAAIVFVALLAAYSVRTIARNGDWRNEEILFSTTVADTPGSARAHMNLGTVHWRNGRADEAIAEYRQALDIEPDYVEALSNLAGIYQSRKQIDDATRLLERAIARAPENAELQNNLGILYLEKKRYAEARRALESVVRSNPRHPRANYNLGLACMMQEDLPAALAAFETAKTAGDEYILSYYYIGLLSVRTGNKQYAKEHLEHYLQSRHTSGRYRQRAETLLEQIEPPAATK